MTDEKDAKPDASTITLSTLISWVEDADNNTGDSRSLSEKCREYYDGRQWSGEEVRVLKKQKQAPIVVNRIKPKMDGLMGMERANKTTAKAFPRTPKHEKAATAATEAIRFCLQDNFYDQVRSTAWDNLCIEGTGGCEVIGKDLGDKVRITINPIMWDRIIYDPHSRRKDFGDARYLGQVVWMDYDLALDMYPDAEDVLQTMMQGSSTYADKPEWLDSKRRRVKIVELYYIEDGDVWYACFTYGGYCKDPQKSPYVNEEGDTEWPYEFASLHVGREGDRYGACKQYLDVQDEINKRRSKALHLMSVRQVMGERGAVEDVNKTRQELARPDGYVEVTPGMVFEVLKTGDMAAAQFNLLTEAKGEIDAVGFSAAASGKEERNMSGVALRNREAASQTELAPLFDVLKHLDVRVYRKVWNRIRQYWKDEMWIRVTDDPINLRWVGLNKPITRGQQMLEQAQQQGVPPEQLQALQQQLAADPMSQEVVSTENDIAQLDVDIVIDDAPDSVTMQQEEFQALSEMVKSGFPIPPTAIVEASNLLHKDRILKEMKEQGGVPPQVQEQMKKLQEESQALAQENQALKADQQTEQQKIAMKAQADRESMSIKAELQSRELQLERERAAAEIQLEREKAEAKIAVETMLAQAQIGIERERLAVEKEKAAHQAMLAERQAAHSEQMAEREAKTKAKTTGVK
jgi:hypothetical protein